MYREEAADASIRPSGDAVCKVLLRETSGLGVRGEGQIPEAKALASAQGPVSWETWSRRPPSSPLPPSLPGSASSCWALPAGLGSSHRGTETLAAPTVQGEHG